MKKIIKNIVLIILILLLLTLVGTLIYLQHDRFGAKATGERLERMKSQPNYENGSFKNIEFTPEIAEGKGMRHAFMSFFFEKDKRNVPKIKLPVIKTDLNQIKENSFVWFGHSSYLIRLEGKNILVDPVFSAYASPVRYRIRAFPMEYEYIAEDMPPIDFLVITHDHWDHLDYNTFMKIKDKVGHIVTGLGVGAHLEKWGFPANKISELCWGDSVKLDGLTFHSRTSRHFSGRMLKRNVTLWSSFVLEGDQTGKSLYLGGDSGYGKHFKEIGDEFGPIDYVILDNGQYNALWKYIHMMPEEVVQAARDLQAKNLIPVHSAKFPLANHAWDEPLKRVAKEGDEQNMSVLTPKIGQIVSLDFAGKFEKWWQSLGNN